MSAQEIQRCGEGWREVATGFKAGRKGHLTRNAGSLQRPEKARQRVFLPEVPGGNAALVLVRQDPFGPLTSRTVR